MFCLRRRGVTDDEGGKGGEKGSRRFPRTVTDFTPLLLTGVNSGKSGSPQLRNRKKGVTTLGVVSSPVMVFSAAVANVSFHDLQDFRYSILRKLEKVWDQELEMLFSPCGVASSKLRKISEKQHRSIQVKITLKNNYQL